MQSSPCVSVIIPTYNRAKYISEAIDSVLAQTFIDYEIIVVDDGSTDNTDEVIYQYQSKYSNFKYIKQINFGPAAARNSGIREAKGEWIAFLDSDDLWDPIKLEVQIKCVTETESFACFSKEITFQKPSELTNILGITKINEITYEKNIKISDFVLLKKIFTTSSCFFKKKLFPSGQALDPSLRYSGEDHKLIYDLFNKGPVSYVNYPLVYFRRSLDCPGFAINNNTAEKTGLMYCDLIRAHTQGYYYYQNIRDKDTRKGARELIGYHLLRRAEIACAYGDFEGTRYLALDAFFFSVNLKRKLTGLTLFIFPTILRKYYVHKWKVDNNE